MQELVPSLNPSNADVYQSSFYRRVTVRGLVSILFRHLKLALVTFLAMFLVAVLYVRSRPIQYEAQVKFLVKHARAEQAIATDGSSMSRASKGVSAEEINSEAQLLKSRDSLRKVVLACGLDRLGDDFTGQDVPPDKEQNIAKAVSKLEKRLAVQLTKTSNIIKVTYVSVDPQLTPRVLNYLADFYLEKHLEVYRPPGVFKFFQQEAERYRQGLAEIQKQLADFNRGQGVISVEHEKENVLSKLSEFESQLKVVQVEVAAAQQRNAYLEEQLSLTPARIVTQVKSSPRVLETLQIKLMDLERTRTELLGIFKPDYPRVQQVSRQITQTETAIAEAIKAPALEETTDRDPTHEWLKSELARARSELVALQARAKAISLTIMTYLERGHGLGQMEIKHGELTRNGKLAEENYLVYVRKQEEARISDALDRQRIVNVAIAEAATVPSFPLGPTQSSMLLVGGLLSGLLSLGIVFVAEVLDRSFRTPSELEAFLNIPVAAAFPKRQKRFYVS